MAETYREINIGNWGGPFEEYTRTVVKGSYDSNEKSMSCSQNYGPLLGIYIYIYTLYMYYITAPDI